MEPEKIARINELARKKRTVGLTEDELTERQALYKEYLAAYRESAKATLEAVRVQNTDGSYAPLKRKDEH